MALAQRIFSFQEMRHIIRQISENKVQFYILSELLENLVVILNIMINNVKNLKWHTYQKYIVLVLHDFRTIQGDSGSNCSMSVLTPPHICIGRFFMASSFSEQLILSNKNELTREFSRAFQFWCCFDGIRKCPNNNNTTDRHLTSRQRS